jgi:dynein heavy chain, axonemal
MGCKRFCNSLALYLLAACACMIGLLLDSSIGHTGIGKGFAQMSIGLVVCRYAGRTELPDNLKALFRPMAMMIPDYALVAEVMLFSEGFENSKNLSRKMVKLYSLSSEQLSQQDHYDFGMRALKSVLVMAGSVKRAAPDLSEDVVLIRAMRDSNIPKLLTDDAELFENIVMDLFPGVAVVKNEYGKLEEAIYMALDAKFLQKPKAFVTKVLQLFETLQVRFGVMTVGPSGSGKTTILHTLQAALTTMRTFFKANSQDFQVTHLYTFNPKCIKMGELYGEYNLLTNEWTDGLGSTLIRNAVNDSTPDKKYVCFDGPVDAIWIENMNTVLDDNCTLCLPNGERIKLNPTTMRTLFEVQDLAVASPATVSRCGMVYVPAEELGWRPFVKTWLQTELESEITSEYQDVLWELFDKYLDPLLLFKQIHGHEYISSVDINLATTVARLVQSLLHPRLGLKIQVRFRCRYCRIRFIEGQKSVKRL